MFDPLRSWVRKRLKPSRSRSPHIRRPHLEVESLEAAYGASQVLFGVSFKVGAGEVVTLLGRNGMGKTTTVRAIMGIMPAKAGAVATTATERVVRTLTMRGSVFIVRELLCTAECALDVAPRP